MRTPNGLRFDANLKWLFTELPFEQRFDAASSAGFTGVEYPAPYPYEPARLRRWLHNAGLRQVLINSPAGEPDSPGRSGLACLPGQVAEFRAGVERGLTYATELDSQFLHILAGVRPPEVSRDRAFAQLVMNIAWAAEQARDTGVRLLVEAQNKIDVPGQILDSQAHAEAIIEAVNADNVGLLFDGYHVQIDEGDLIRTLRRCLPWIFHLQVADPPDRTEPGTGEVSWPLFFQTLRDADYQGWIGCEYRPRTTTVDGLAWLTELT